MSAAAGWIRRGALELPVTSEVRPRQPSRVAECPATTSASREAGEVAGGASHQWRWSLWHDAWYFARQRSVTQDIAYEFLARHAAHSWTSTLNSYNTDELPEERCELYLEVYNGATPHTAHYFVVRIQNMFTHEKWDSISYVAANFGSR